MTRWIIFTIINIALLGNLVAQQPLAYFLKGYNYQGSIPDPERVLGIAPGEWHLTHDQLVRYFEALERSSDRVHLIEYGRSHEQRPLFVAVITSPENLARLDEIRREREVLWDGKIRSDIDYSEIPGVVYQGYGVHGNESSGSNAAALVAYHLAAALDEEVKALLDENVILLDPCFNPDGLNRFASWVNQNKNMLDNADPNSRELNEPWPGSRTNHYWFDLNRDYLMTQHPETKGRIELFRQWMPEIFTDHHEMGSNSTFFFQPGIPTRVHPLTPADNQVLTEKIGVFHARYLNDINSLYFNKENYDDFFYGKGSTYPDVNGSIGILFEQASSRGHLRETKNGPLSFPFTIRNQVATSLSTQDAMRTMREELLRYKRSFFNGALEAASRDASAGVLIGHPHDRGVNRELVRILLSHDIEMYATRDNEMPFFIPYDQANYFLIKSLVEERKTFEDSLFYDISAWTLPHALGVPFEEIARKARLQRDTLVTAVPEVGGRLPEQDAGYAYLIPWNVYYAPSALQELISLGIRVRFAEAPFSIDTDAGNRQFDRGTLIVSVQGITMHPKNLYGQLKRIQLKYGIDVYASHTGQSLEGPSLGSNKNEVVAAPRIGILTGSGVNAYEAGSLWHLLDHRYRIPCTMVDPDRLSEDHLDHYTHLILPGGAPNEGGEVFKASLRNWVSRGGTLLATGNAIDWLSRSGLANITRRDGFQGEDTEQWIPFDQRSTIRGARRVSGSLFSVELDKSHPMAFGYDLDEMTVFRSGTTFYDPLNGSDTPIRFAKDYHVAGYVPGKLGEVPSGSAYLSVQQLGRGHIVLFADSPNFRSYFWVTNRLVANVLFFSNAF